MGTGIVLDTTFDNSDLPIATPYGERIRALESFHSWFQADRDRVTLASGKVASFNDLGGTAAVLSQATTSKRATLVSEDIGDYSGAAFSRDNLTNYALSGATLNMNSPFSFALVMKVPAYTSGESHIFAGQAPSAPTDRQCLYCPGTGNLLQWSRNASTLIMQYVPDKYQLVIVSWDGAKLRGESTDSSAVADVAVAGTTTSIVALGANGSGTAADFNVADMMLFTSDLLADADAAQLVRDYAKYVYGIGA